MYSKSLSKTIISYNKVCESSFSKKKKKKKVCESMQY